LRQRIVDLNRDLRGLRMVKNARRHEPGGEYHDCKGDRAASRRSWFTSTDTLVHQRRSLMEVGLDD
jgi:hypothetical protein